MGASKKFKVGDRVVPSEEGVKSFAYRNGVVVGFSKDERHVKIAYDDQKTPRTFRPRLWFVCNWITPAVNVPYLRQPREARKLPTELRRGDLRRMAVLGIVDKALIE